MLRAYSVGLFPMGETADNDQLFWLDPDQRGIIPLDHFHLPRRLWRSIRHFDGHITIDRDFGAVIHACAVPGPQRPQTWINQPIIDCYQSLHHQGYAHSVEVWDHDGQLIGGLYGVALGAAFFGESMFSRATNASKMALAHLVGRLRIGGFSLLDTQFTTDHLSQFGTCEIPRQEYRQHLSAAINKPADFMRADSMMIMDELCQLMNRDQGPPPKTFSD